MFLCVSLNPAVDKRITLRDLQLGRVNRALNSIAAPGGKAAHVAMVLRTLGAEPIWVGFVGGASGISMLDGLRGMSICAEAVNIGGSTRTNLELVDDKGVTEVLEPGPHVAISERQRFEDKLREILAKSPASTVIFSGSLPPGVPVDFYCRLVTLTHEYGGRAFVDSSGEAFKMALQAQPEFVKPNQEEAESWRGSTIDGIRSAAVTLNAMLDAGACAGALSLGADGLIFRPSKQQHDTFFASGPELSVKSSVGSGDATLAGFAFAGQQGLPPMEAVRLAAACGAANCLAEGPGLARAVDIERLKREIHVEVLQ
ncbi:MAG TPA: hexose kinase [Candidatus Acidoferrum sp.]